MSVLHAEIPTELPLSTGDGELILITVETESRALEHLLDVLASLPFPVNPQIHHPARAGDRTRVEFPAYSTQQDVVRRTLSAWPLTAVSMWKAIGAA